MQSLEAALRYNPESLELMTSLAEVYIRMGRFDPQTMELCEKVLTQNVDNPMLQQAQSIGLLIEQSRQLDESLSEGTEPPEATAVESAITILDEFLATNSECKEAWIAWIRFQLLAGDFEKASQGIHRLQGLGADNLVSLFESMLEYAGHTGELSTQQGEGLARIYRSLESSAVTIRRLEKLFDEGTEGVGPALLEHYLERYDADRPEEVPENSRQRLLRLLLDFGDSATTGRWLRKASLLGWQVDDHSVDYARMLVDQEALDEAFGVLQRLRLTPEVRDLMNEIAHHYERLDQVEQAVAVLRYLNDHALIEEEEFNQSENLIVREAELSMGELQMKNGRPEVALNKFINALTLGQEVDLELLQTIEELIEQLAVQDTEPLLRLGMYFRQKGDHPKAITYLNKALGLEPGNPDVLQELEAMFKEILTENPDLPKLHLELGKIYMQTGRPAMAVEELRQAAMSPALTQDANRMLAQLLHDEGKLTEALEKFRSLNLGTQDFDELYALHEELLKQDANREALIALDLIAKIRPDWRDVTDKARLLEDRIGKLQPEVMVDPKMRELIGDLAIGRYQYMDRIGSGGMGVVHKVFDIRTQTTVAMKILRDSLSSSSKALDRFFREARIAASLKHRNITEIYDFNISNNNGQSFIVMEYIDGPSMREIIDNQFQNTMSTQLDYITEILYYGLQLCDALEATHAKGIIHRDIKPDNIMVNGEGMVKITDFGIVHIEEATFTPSGAMLGTPRYMSPEQVTGGKVDGRSDIYSVGIVFYEAMAGSPPFMTGDIAYQQVHNDPVVPMEINTAIPEKCSELILRCLAKKPQDRYENAHELKTAMSEILDELGGCTKYGNQDFTQVGGLTGVDEPQSMDELDSYGEGGGLDEDLDLN